MIWYKFQREVNQELWYYVLGELIDEFDFKNDIFSIKAYDDEEYEFYHKPSGVKIRWYKYPLRSPVINMPLTHEQFLAVLYDCRDSITSGTHLMDKWWRLEYDKMD